MEKLNKDELTKKTNERMASLSGEDKIFIDDSLMKAIQNVMGVDPPLNILPPDKEEKISSKSAFMVSSIPGKGVKIKDLSSFWENLWKPGKKEVR